MYVVATAGHVDHGKSALVLALTGIDPDRLEEEKRRGLTIDLGFAWLKLPSGREVGIVDVPGHERFIRNMLAGVGAINATIFVVAANEGWKPQSQEHLDILDLLGVSAAVVVVTKADLVDADTLGAVMASVRERIAGTSLGDAPVLAVSSTTGGSPPMRALRTAATASVRGAISRSTVGILLVGAEPPPVVEKPSTSSTLASTSAPCERRSERTAAARVSISLGARSAIDHSGSSSSLPSR